MASKSICVVALTIALVCSPVARATFVDVSPLKTSIESAVNDAVQKVLSSVNQVSDHVDTTVTQTSQTINAFTQPIISTTGSVAQQLMNDYRAMGQQLAQSYQNLGQQFLSSVGAVSGQMGALGNQLTPILDAYETQYCTPAKFTPSVKKPAKFTGPSFELSFNAGLCFLDDEALMYDNVKQLNCTEPFIVFSKNPSNFTSKYKSAPMFTSKECKIEKVFGEPIKKVLYVFDGSQQIDLNALTANVLSEIRTLVGGVVGPAHTQLATQLQKFMSSMVSLPQHLLAPKLSMPNLFTTSTTGMPVVMAQPKATQATQR